MTSKRRFPSMECAMIREPKPPRTFRMKPQCEYCKSPFNPMETDYVTLAGAELGELVFCELQCRERWRREW